MCCIFTCCGWMIDLLQRVWVFAMSCVISSAVCCVLITASMSGVALGYNYSLAEYIDLKETNVSVFMKRGVFDDDINEGMDWRRKGQNPPKAPKNEGNFKTAAPDEPEQMPLQEPNSRRRLDNSILDSDGQNKFEGSLMKLTALPLHPSTTTEGATGDLIMSQALSSFPPGSLDQLKAIQGVINMRKSMADRGPIGKGVAMSTYGYDSRFLPHFPQIPPDQVQARKMMSMTNERGPYHPELEAMKPKLHEYMTPPGPSINPARLAVPSDNSQGRWLAPKLSPEAYRKVFDQEDDPPSYPKPVTYRTGPIRPPTKTTQAPEVQRMPATHQILPPGLQISGEKELEDIKTKASEDMNKENDLEARLGPKIIGNENTDYYDDDAMKGLPVRRRRSINKIRAKVQPHVILEAKAIPQKSNLGLLTKFNVGKSISNEITDYPSILVRKLHFHNNALSNETTSTTNEKKEGNSSKTVGVTVNDCLTIIDSFKDKVLRIIQSMLS